MFFEDEDFIFSSYARHGIAPPIGELLLVDITLYIKWDLIK